MTKIFIIGATGHIGGAVLDLIYSAHPDAALTVLIRDNVKAERLCLKYPRVSTVIGNLDSLELLESNAQAADIVINTAPDATHETGIAGILRGLRSRDAKKFYIHTSGAALIWDEPDGSKAGSKVWDDVKDIEAITSMPDTTTHSLTDKLALSASVTVNVAIISPTLVYGISPATEHPLPLTLPETMNAIKSISSGFTISEGRNILGFIHVIDLARLYLLLVSHALHPQPSTVDVWGPTAYYFGSDKELSFLEYMAPIVNVLKKRGLLETGDLQEINVKQVAKASGATIGIPTPDVWSAHIAIMFGVNMRVRSSRAMSLGWQPREVGVEDTLEEVIETYLDTTSWN